ncbi:MAG: amino acid adenylation domain-containing protein [Microbacteriaceae bacterium]|nr:amino acid adenylation domain-containing protein [Microbacteriaceae bacterium]
MSSQSPAASFAPPAIAFGPRWPVASTLVRDQVLETAAAHPGSPALKEGATTTSYAELADGAGAIARWLLRNTDVAAQTEPIVAVVGGRSSKLITTLLGIWRAGAVYLPIASDYPISRIQYLIGDAKPAVTIVDHATTDAELVGEIARLTTAVGIDEVLAGAPAAGAEPELDALLDPHRSGASAAYVIYTSGSTGNPKGTVLTHGNIRNFVAAHLVDIGLTMADRQGWSGNVSFDASVADIWPALSEGATICIAPPHANENLRVLLDWLRDDRVTCTLVPTAVVNMLFGLEDEWWHDLSLRVMLTGGDRLTRRPPSGLPFSFINAYGPTEATVWTTLQRVPSMPLRFGSQAPSIGHPITNAFITILDEDLRQCVVGQQGELCIGGAGVARGYLHRPDVTREKFVHDFWSDPGLGSVLYRTGDQAVLLPGGLLQFVGRSDRQIALQGFRIEAGEVEAVLMADEHVKEAVVKRHDYENLGPRLIAFVTLRDRAKAAEHPIEAIRERMREKVPAYMVPNQFVILDEMPMTPNGKVDEKALTPPPRSREALVADDALTAAYRAPSSAAEQRVAEVFADVLAMDLVGVDDDFFDIGGDSLAGVAVMARLEKSFDTALPTDALQQAPTPAALAALITGEAGVPAAAAPASRDWEAESRHELPVPQRTSVAEDAAVFVTGAGGFIGGAVVAELLARDPRLTVNALVHSPESGDRLLARFDADRARLRVLVGDLGSPEFGLGEAEQRLLVEHTRAVVHMGAQVNHFKTYEALRADNVEATSTAAELAWVAGGGTVPIVFTSSISVDDESGPDGLSANGYARGKQIAERRLQHAGEQGLPVRVLRVGRALPDSRGGAFNPNDTLQIFFSACAALGATPAWRFTEPGHPVDGVARAIVDAALDPAPAPGAEVRYPPMASWSSAAFAAALESLRPLREVAWDEWVALLQADGGITAQRALALLSANSSEDLLRDNSAETAEYIARIGAATNALDAAYYAATAAELLRE